MNNNDRIMVFIPCYRCAAQISRVLRQFTQDVQKLIAEVVVVDNRSPDDTINEAKAGLSEIRHCKKTLLLNCDNYNLGGSHKVAFDYFLQARYDYIIVLHGDDQGSISDLIPLLKRGMHRNVDSLLGSRFDSASKLVGYSLFRRYGNVAFNLLISAVTRRRVTDMGAGLNLYRRQFLENRFYQTFPNNLTFNVFMLYYSIWSGSQFSFFPLTWREDDQVSNAKIFRQAWVILKLTIQFMVNPKRLFPTTTVTIEDSPYKSDIIFTADGFE